MNGLFHAAVSGVLVVIELLDAGIVVVHGCLSHMDDQLAGLVQGQHGVGDQVHIQLPDTVFQVRIFVLLLGPVGNDPFGQRGQDP